MILLLVLIGFGVAALAPWLYSILKERTGWVLAAYPLAVFVILEVLSGRVANGNRVTEAHEYLPSMGISLSFALDGLSLLFGLLISGIGALVVIYAGGYLKGHPLLGRFFAYLMMFMSAMLGVVLADDLIALFVFWELTSISSYLLIGFNHEEEKSREAALQALLVTGGGGLALLAGLLMLGTVAGTFEISAIREQGDLIRGHALYVPIFALIALGAFTKSAQFPFHFWLPNAMAAPTPVSAYLHSATMVKAGVYLLARFDVVLGGTPVWTWTLGLAGLATMTLGAIRALRETDLKRILAYSTVTALGTLIAADRAEFQGRTQGSRCLPRRALVVQRCAVHGRRQRRSRNGDARRYQAGRTSKQATVHVEGCLSGGFLDGRLSTTVWLHRERARLQSQVGPGRVGGVVGSGPRRTRQCTHRYGGARRRTSPVLG